MSNGVIMVFNNSEKSLIVYHANSAILGCIFLSNCERFILAAIIYNRIVPVSVRLLKNALDAAIQALGGQAYLNVQDISQEGRTFSFHHGQPNSFGVRFWRFYKYPDKDRVELTPKRDVVYIYNGDKGYEVTFKGTRPLDAKELSDYLRRQHYALDQ